MKCRLPENTYRCERNTPISTPNLTLHPFINRKTEKHCQLSGPGKRSKNDKTCKLPSTLHAYSDTVSVPIYSHHVHVLHVDQGTEYNMVVSILMSYCEPYKTFTYRKKTFTLEAFVETNKI